MNNTFTLVLIQFICVACLLVCKYTNQKKVELWTNSDWNLIYSGQKYCILIGRFDSTFFRAWLDFTASQRWFLKQQFCLTDLKVRFWYATMNASWIQLWVQGEMCGNNTIKLDHDTYKINIFPMNSNGKKIHTLPRCGLVTIQIVRHILCSNNFWCGFVCQGVFFLTNAVLKSCTFYTGSIVALLS